MDEHFSATCNLSEFEFGMFKMFTIEMQHYINIHSFVQLSKDWNKLNSIKFGYKSLF